MECGEEKVHCLVTRAALIFLAGCFLLERDYEKVFGTYREAIERTAARKSQVEHRRCFRLTVNVHDLVACGAHLGVSDDRPKMKVTAGVFVAIQLPSELRLRIHPEDWRWSRSERFRWCEHEGHGYWRRGAGSILLGSRRSPMNDHQ